MGAAFGSISDTCLDFVLIQTGKYEIRSYDPIFVVEIECDDDHLKESFSALMGYIGANGVPENVKGNIHFFHFD